MNNIFLNIADFKIKIQTEQGFTTVLETGWSPFISKITFDIADITINAYAGIPENLLNNTNPIFDASNDDLNFYSVYREVDSLRFIIFDQENNKAIQQVAICSKNFTQWDVYSEPASANSLITLKYPLGPLVMYYLTVRFDAIMIHASGVFDGSKGRIFTGFSGAGKSTISRLWLQANNHIINDDRLIIRKQANGYFIYNTPMYYDDNPKKTTIHSIFLISHAQKNTLRKIQGALAVTRVLAHCIQNNYNSNYINHHLNFLANLCSKTKVYELGFVPNQSVVDFVIEADS